MKNICEECVNYFNYKDIEVQKDKEETKTVLAFCLLLGVSVKFKTNDFKSFAQSCSHFKKKRTF